MAIDNEILNQINSLSKEDLELLIQYKPHMFSKEEMDLIKSRYNKLCEETGETHSVTSNDLSKVLSFQLDDIQTTLTGIFKCVNFIKNVILAGLICGGIGIGIIILNMLAGN